jgi:tRNA/tmRNA/rRNA uracil-C5-methylase (TrmA/RlmC/RlmD family)
LLQENKRDFFLPGAQLDYLMLPSENTLVEKGKASSLLAGAETVLTIDSIAFGGSGVARINDFVVFVPFVMEGEKVKVQIVKVKARYAEAVLLEVIEPSPFRVLPPCPYFTRCGGCSYQHIPYSKQLELKNRQVEEVFRQLSGGRLTVLEETEPSPLPYFYRTKIRMKFKCSKMGHRFGYYDYFEKNHLIDVEECRIASEKLNNYLKNARLNEFEFFRKKGLRSYNLAWMETESGVVDNLGPSLEVETHVLGKRFIHNRESFFQINHSIFSRLFEILQEVIRKFSSRNETLLDLFCGVGFFGILLSDGFKKVDFVEENKVSFRFLLKNAELNGLSGRSNVFCRPAASSFFALADHYDVIFVDPPRIGASEAVVRQIASKKPNLVLYLSCNPSTQVRDMNWFFENGLELVYLKPFDFFPQTKHIETLAVFKPVKK